MDNRDLSSQIGIVGADIVEKFNLDISPETPIYFGQKNISHIREKHGQTYDMFGHDIQNILMYPDYVGLNPKDSSLEYYKSYNETTIHIKVAVRPTQNNISFLRTMYEISDVKLKNYLRSERIKAVEIDKSNK